MAQPEISCRSNGVAAPQTEELRLTDIVKCTVAPELGLAAFSVTSAFISSPQRETIEGNSALGVSGKSVLTLVELSSLTPELTVPCL